MMTSNDESASNCSQLSSTWVLSDSYRIGQYSVYGRGKQRDISSKRSCFIEASIGILELTSLYFHQVISDFAAWGAVGDSVVAVDSRSFCFFPSFFFSFFAAFSSSSAFAYCGSPYTKGKSQYRRRRRARRAKEVLPFFHESSLWESYSIWDTNREAVLHYEP